MGLGRSRPREMSREKPRTSARNACTGEREGAERGRAQRPVFPGGRRTDRHVAAAELEGVQLDVGAPRRREVDALRGDLRPVEERDALAARAVVLDGRPRGTGGEEDGGRDLRRHGGRLRGGFRRESRGIDAVFFHVEGGGVVELRLRRDRRSGRRPAQPGGWDETRPRPLRTGPHQGESAVPADPLRDREGARVPGVQVHSQRIRAHGVRGIRGDVHAPVEDGAGAAWIGVGPALRGGKRGVAAGPGQEGWAREQDRALLGGEEEGRRVGTRKTPTHACTSQLVAACTSCVAG